MLKKRRILIVEDNPINAKVAMKILEKLGQDAKWVENPSEVEGKMLEEAFDLVLMDLQMPEIGGVELAEKIRALPPPACRVPIVAVTASDLSGERGRCHAASMNGFIIKPITRAILDKELQRLFPDEAVDIAQEGERERPENSAPLLDVAWMASFEKQIGKEIYHSLVLDFERMLPDLESKAASALAENDLLKLQKVAHKIKGSAGQLGASELKDIAHGLMHTTPGDMGDNLAGLVGQAFQCYRHSVSELKAALGGSGESAVH